MKKTLVALFFLIILLNNSYAFNHIINVKCNTTSKKVFDKNRNNISDNVLPTGVIYTFDSRKQKLIKVNFNKTTIKPAIINEEEIQWHYWQDQKSKDLMKTMYDMDDSGIVVSSFKINRFTGLWTHEMYTLDKVWTFKYLGGKIKDGKVVTSHIDEKSLRFLENNKRVLATGLNATRSNYPQKSIIHMASIIGECSKAEPKKKF
tara:strand:+ start:215 stop:826 length:612 start_codon:yes stop_codon:yes gene_type:complete